MGSVVTGVTSFQGCVKDFCMSQIMPPFGCGGGAVGTAGVLEDGRFSFPIYPSPLGPSKLAYISAMFPY